MLFRQSDFSSMSSLAQSVSSRTPCTVRLVSHHLPPQYLLISYPLPAVLSRTISFRSFYYKHTTKAWQPSHHDNHQTFHSYYKIIEVVFGE